MATKVQKKQASVGKKANQGNRPQKQQQKSRRDKPQLSVPGRLSAAPVAKGRVGKTNKPTMRSLPNGDCHIRHREYLADIVSGSGTPSVFNVTSFPVNPGQAAFAPWLSQIAPRFEKFLIHSLRFDYETEAPTSLGGSVILSLDYDALDAAPTTKQQALAYRGSVRSPPWEECCHVSAREDLSQQKAYFVRPGAQPAGSDLRLYDVGNLFVISQNIATPATTLGELYVEYDVTLMTPVLEGVSLAPSMAFSSSGGGGSVSPALPLGVGPVIVSSPGSPALKYNSATGDLTALQAGNYCFFTEAIGTVITAFVPVLTNTSGGSSKIGDSGDNIRAGALVAWSNQAYNLQVGDSVNFSWTATTMTASDCIITTIDSGVAAKM